ncbi:MAG: ABC transporter substrate-binding protein [Pseudomonadota bacterium]
MRIEANVKVAVLAALVMSGGFSAVRAQDQTASPEEETIADVSKKAEPTQIAEDFIISFNADALSILQSANAEDDAEGIDADVALRALLRERMAIEYLSRVLLGDARNAASEDQIASYDAVFPDYISNVYAGQLKQLGDKEFTVTKSVRTRPREIIVRTEYHVKSSSKPVAVDWRLRLSRDEAEVKLVDAAVKGVSTVLVERDTFKSIVKNEGFDVLVTSLEEKAAAAASPNVDIESET